MVGNNPGLLGRIFGKKKEAEPPSQEPSSIELKQYFVRFQQNALESLNKMRMELSKDNRAAVITINEKFYHTYNDFTKKQPLFRKAGGRLYMEYRIFIGAIGPAYEELNNWVNGKTKDSTKALVKLRDAVKILSEQDIRDIDTAIAAK